MHVFQLHFACATPDGRDDHQHAIEYLLSALRQNGQICGKEQAVAARPDGYAVTVMSPRADSLTEAHENPWVRKAGAKLLETGLEGPRVVSEAEEPFSASPCECAGGRGSLILFTNYVSLESPLRCGDCFGPVPLYTVPATADDEYHDVLCWESDHQACDTLQMNCRTGERFGYREMSRVDSSLSRRGREICGKIERSTGIPTYYYLHRYGGRGQAAERRRLCPGCGQGWLLREPLHDRFDFQCSGCRLLSNISPSA